MVADVGCGDGWYAMMLNKIWKNAKVHGYEGTKDIVSLGVYDDIFTIDLTKIRYIDIDYEYTGSQGYYGDGGYAMKIDDIKAAAAAGNPTAMGMAQGIVDEAQDARFYIRYRF